MGLLTMGASGSGDFSRHDLSTHRRSSTTRRKLKVPDISDDDGDDTGDDECSQLEMLGRGGSIPESRHGSKSAIMVQLKTAQPKASVSRCAGLGLSCGRRKTFSFRCVDLNMIGNL